METIDPYTILGAIGVALRLFGFWRTSHGKWRSTSVWYELDTIVGASLIIVYEFQRHIYITLPINFVLVYISFRGLSSYAERYEQRQQRKRLRQKSRNKKPKRR